MTSYFLDAAELAAMRDDVASMLPGTAIIQSKSRASDGAGGGSATWAAVTGGTVAARLDPMTRQGGGAEEYALREAGVNIYQLTLPYNAPLAMDNRVQMGGINYEVRSVDTGKDWAVSLRAVVVKVE